MNELLGRRIKELRSAKKFHTGADGDSDWGEQAKIRTVRKRH